LPDNPFGFGFLFWRVGKALRREVEARSAALDVTPPQFHVLFRLWHGDGILTSELTKDIWSDGGTITGLIDRLEAKGLVRRERDPDDRRAVRIYLTPAGRDREAPLRAMLAAVDAQAVEGFRPEERAALLQALARVAANLGAWETCGSETERG